jgi:hypothetical protein
MKTPSPSLFDVAAERIAMSCDRPLSQVRIELEHGTPPKPAGGLFRPGRELVAQRCASCDGIFAASPRADSTCNLCRRSNAQA